MPLPQGSRLLALVNPAAGNGTAEALISEAITQVFAPAGIVVERLTTSRLGHARDYVQSLSAEELYSLSGLIIVSGDGLIAEVLQGLSRRSDADQALQVPLAPYPAGSGNGLCKSIMHACGYEGDIEPLDVARVITNGEFRALDLATISLSGPSAAVPSPFTSFLSVSWGLIGDVDISADFLRAHMGAGRFQHSYSRRLRYPRLYHGSLTYRPAGVSVADAPLSPLEEPLEGTGWVRLEGPFLTLWACNVPWMTLTSHVAPNAQFDDGLWQLAVGHGAALADMTPDELGATVLEIQEAMNDHNGSPVVRGHRDLSMAACNRLAVQKGSRTESVETNSQRWRKGDGARTVHEPGGCFACHGHGRGETEGDVDRVIELAATGKTVYSDQQGFISVDGEWAAYGPVQVDVGRTGSVFL